MTNETAWRIYGSELSPYSLKVRAYFHYKQIPHQWIIRSQDRMEEFQRYAKLPLVPLVLSPTEEVMQDSTPIIEKLERRFIEPALEPTEPVSAFVSLLLEEYGDEWVNKPMFHYRWSRETDQQSAAGRLAVDMLPSDADEQALSGVAEVIKQRMVPRLSFVGSNEGTAPIIEESFATLTSLLQAHLASRPYLFGGRPCMADFGIAPQLYQCLTDPTAGGLLRDNSPAVTAWCERMLTPQVQGKFETWDALAATLEPLLAKELAAVFLPWSTANAVALARGDEKFEVELNGRPFVQQTQKYHARSLAALKQKYADAAAQAGDESMLTPLLKRSGCLGWLAD